MSDPASEAHSSRRSRTAIRLIWIERLQRFDPQAHSTPDFCAAEGVSLASFYLWKRRLAAEQVDSVAEPTRLLPVRITAAPAPVELLLPGGAVLRLAPGCDLEFVRSLLTTLGAAPC